MPTTGSGPRTISKSPRQLTAEVTTVGCRKDLETRKFLFLKQRADLGIFSIMRCLEVAWSPSARGDQSAHAIVFRTLLTIREERKSFGDPKKLGHPVVNGVPQWRRSPMGGGPILRLRPPRFDLQVEVRRELV